MEEFHNAVAKLLGVFSCGISMIKAQRRTNDVKPDSTNKKVAMETQLSKSLKKTRLEVENAYGEDLLRFGPKFADGDAEAQSSLSQILHRLNAAIKRFTSGKTAKTDYQALLNLSNASRIEAINTFEQLSQRLSQSSLALVPISLNSETRKHRHRQRSKKSAVSRSKHTHPKSRSELSATPAGLVRLKTGAKPPPKSSMAFKDGSTNPKHRASKASKSSQAPDLPSKQSPNSGQRQVLAVSPIVKTAQPLTSLQYHNTSSIESPRHRAEKRKSLVSFASDSTKIGEIPEHKLVATQAHGYHRIIYYPVELYQQPEKQRSRFMKLFRK